MKADRKELFDLIERACNDAMGPQEAARLEELLRGDVEAQQLYMVYRQTEAALAWEFGRLAETVPCVAHDVPPSVLAAAEAAAKTQLSGSDENGTARRLPGEDQKAPASPVLGFLGDVGRQGWGFVSDHTLLFSVLAALVVVGSVTALIVRNGELSRQITAARSEIPNPQSPAVARDGLPNPSSPPTVAWLVRGAGCRWNGQPPAPEFNAPLAAGQSLHLASGVAEIHFDIGARVTLQSPASFQLVSANTVRLAMGKATVEIQAEQARGFKVLTPEAAFVDQGTEFGVEVTPSGRSKVHVFQGLVDVDLEGREGRSAPAPCRLQANYGARMEQGSETMTLVEDTGECFIRSMDEADRDRHVVAYWRFEDRPVGTLLPHTDHDSQAVCATVDSSFNGNDLYAFSADNQPSFSADVPAAAVPRSGSTNRCCLDVSSPTQSSNRRNVSTHSAFSHASPQDVQKISPQQWTIEASVKAAKLSAKPQGFLGRDATCTLEPLEQRAPARLIFQINAQNRFAISFRDAADRLHEAVAKDLAVEPGRWYHLAATSDGRTLRLFVDATDGRGYQQRAECELPKTGSTALGKGKDDAAWSIGRAGNTEDAWLRFEGLIDEVRICDAALAPAEFLFVPKGKD